MLTFELLLLLSGILSLSTGYENYDCVGDRSPAGGDGWCTTSDCVKTAGKILSAMDLTADPCKDFYQFVCGGFEQSQTIAPGETGADQFSALNKLRQKQLLGLLTSPPPASEPPYRAKARRYYKACMDLEHLNNSLTGLRQIISKMGGLLLQCNEGVSKSWTLNNALTLYEAYRESGMFSTGVSVDEKNVSQNVLVLAQGNLLLGADTRDYFLNKTIETDPIMLAIVKLWTEMIKLVFPDKPAPNRGLLVEVLQFEKRRAETVQPQSELADHLAIYKKVDIAFLQKNYNFMNWLKYYQDMFAPANVTLTPSEPVVMYGTSYFERMTPLINEYLTKLGGKRTLQNFFSLRALMSYAVGIGGPFQPIADEFSAAYVGTKGTAERADICYGDVDSNIGFPLGSMFAEKYFPPADKEKASSVITQVITNFRARIDQASWMDDATKKRAYEKVDLLENNVGFPDWILNDTYMENRFSKFVVTDDYLQNKIAANTYGKNEMLTTLRNPPDRADWSMTPQTINAYYAPTKNVVVVPAGILNTPFFYSIDGIPAALNFGAIGGTAGHEITHGFDNTGAQFDKLGNLVDWWEPASKQHFTERSACFVEKFNAYDVDGTKVNGEQTLGENIADDGAVKTAYLAYKKYEADAKNNGTYRKLVGLGNMTPDQLFFIGWSQPWCNIRTPAAAQNDVLTDSHAPMRFRVNGPLSNSDEFAAAYRCSAGSPMVAAKKCQLW